MPIAAPQTFLTQKTTACLFAHVEPDDPAMLATARGVLKELASASPEAGDSADTDAGKVTEIIGALAPLQCVVTVESDDQGVARGGVALSLRHGARLLTLLARKKSATPLGKLDGADVVRLGETGRMAILGNNYMLSHNQGLLKTWIARLKAERARMEQTAGGAKTSVSVSAAFKRAYSRLDLSLPLVFVCTNANGDLASLFGLLDDKTASDFAHRTGLTSDSILSLSAEVRPVGPKAAEVTFLIDCGDRAGAAQLKDRLEAAIAGIGKEWPLGRTSLAVRPPGVLVVEGRVEDLPAQAVAIVAGIVRHARKAQDQAPHDPDRVPANGPTMSI